MRQHATMKDDREITIHSTQHDKYTRKDDM